MVGQIAIACRWLTLVALGLVAGALWSGGAWADGLSGSTSSDVAHVAVYVDIRYCAFGAVQCTTPGHYEAAAAAGNHNPVRIVVQISGDTGGGLFAPIDGLASSLFSVSTQFVPAGGAGVEKLACLTCFQTVTGGTYALFVHPIGNNLWRSGSYFVQIHFPSEGTRLFPTIARIDIP